ncbi:hypothetical protein V2J09_015032 [Rumex salicifolius]
MDKEQRSRRKRGGGEMEGEVVSKVSEAIAAIDEAKRSDDVVLALHSLALLFFPVDTRTISGLISELYRDQLERSEGSSGDVRKARWKAFYHGAGFSSFSRVLLYAQKAVYDVFFTNGLATEVVQALVPSLELKGGGGGGHDANAIRANAARLLDLCLLENRGVLHIAREFNDTNKCGSFMDISKLAQLVASIPDKATLGTPKSLSPQYPHCQLFFKHITFQLLAAAEERSADLSGMAVSSCKNNTNYTFQFVGEMFARICRRGSVDLVVSVIIPQALKRVKSYLASVKETVREDAFKSEQSFEFWFLMFEVTRDQYAVERMAEQILRQLATEDVSSVEAYWILWMLFHHLLENHSSFRFLFAEKFLLWKVFPFCCLRWILQFAVLEFPPDAVSSTKVKNNSGLLDAVQRLSAVWSKLEFVQSAPLEQQLYITAALGLLLENMTREDLDSTKEVMHSLLEGVSCRLGNPSEPVRRMASNIALVFSKVIDPQNPLYLDDSCSTLSTLNSNTPGTVNADPSTSQSHERQREGITDSKRSAQVNGRSRKSSQYSLVDPDEIIDPATLNVEKISDDEDDDYESEDSESSSDSSLEPYDLTDNDSDLKKNITQLVDVVGTLRKTDDPDGVERALNNVENLVRASPDELCHIAGELAKTLVQVRCSEVAVEGEEETAEGKRQKALTSLLVTCPFESLDTLQKLLYSPHLDVSQRIIILDVMTDAALELASTKMITQKHKSQPLISTTAESQPWFMPSSKGISGASPWKEIADTETPLNWSHRYERTLPSNRGQMSKGKTRRWSSRLINLNANETEWSTNKFPIYAAAFMLPAMQGFDKKRHGVDLIDRDFIVLGKLIYMLGVCMKCAALHPEASALALPLLDMLSSRSVCHHKEAFVRKSVLFAASCTLMALHPSYVATALTEGNQEVLRGLEWIRTRALDITESDTDRECYTMAMACLQLHAEMSFQASRALESMEGALKTKSIELPSKSNLLNIKIPNSTKCKNGHGI